MVSYVVTASSPQLMPAQVLRERYSPPPSPPPARDTSARQPSRGRPTSRLKKIDVRELEDKFKDLQQARKKDDSEQREQDRQQRRQAVSHQQTLMRQQRAAERDVQRRELEVDRLEKGLHKVAKETRLKSTKQSETVGKIDDTLMRLETRQQELELELEKKVKESAAAKGRLAHIEFANTLLTQGQVAVAVDRQLEDASASDGEGAPMAGAIIRASAGQTAAERERQLIQKAEELRAANKRRAEDNARLRKQLDEVRKAASRQPKPPPIVFACLGGELAGGTFYNLWDEGLDTHLGPAFSLLATIRYDSFRRGSKVFDFGCGDGIDNIYVGNQEETNTLVFAVYKGRTGSFLPHHGSFLTINDFWVPGETNDYLFVVTPEGHMKVYCDGDLVGSRKGQTMRTTERRNLYVGRSNWESDQPFEGKVANIKVWNQAVEWSSTQRPIKASPAEAWALEHPPAAATAATCTYPNGATLAFAEFAPTLAPLVVTNQAHRERILKDIDNRNHTEVAARVYQSRGWDLEGNLAWRSGEVGEFITLVFQELSLAPPSESQLYPIYAKFATEWSNELPALECLCLADAVLRTVFHSEEVKENALPQRSPGRSSESALPQRSPGRSSSVAAPTSTYASSGEVVAASSVATTSARSPVITPARQHFVQDAVTPSTQAAAVIATPARLISAEYLQNGRAISTAPVQAVRIVREVERGAWEMTQTTMLTANA